MLLVESRAVFERRRFHRRKAHLVLSALRHRAVEPGDQALFLQTRTYGEALDRVAGPLSACQPTSWAAEKFVRSRPGIEVLPARGSCTSRAEFGEWAGRRETLRLEDFYRDARDAMLSGDRVMAHSPLSAPMNLGLLDPLDCAHAAEEAYRAGRAPLVGVEGYIRQLIGRRAYIWHEVVAQQHRLGRSAP